MAQHNGGRHDTEPWFYTHPYTHPTNQTVSTPNGPWKFKVPINWFETADATVLLDLDGTYYVFLPEVAAKILAVGGDQPMERLCLGRLIYQEFNHKGDYIRGMFQEKKKALEVLLDEGGSAAEDPREAVGKKQNTCSDVIDLTRDPSAEELAKENVVKEMGELRTKLRCTEDRLSEQLLYQKQAVEMVEKENTRLASELEIEVKNGIRFRIERFDAQMAHKNDVATRESQARVAEESATVLEKQWSYYHEQSCEEIAELMAENACLKDWKKRATGDILGLRREKFRLMAENQQRKDELVRWKKLLSELPSAT